MRVEASACCRVDLAGGTLDIWPLGLIHSRARTVNVAVSVEARVALEPRRRDWVVDLGSESLRFETPAAMLRDPRTVLVGQIVDLFELPPSLLAPSSDSPQGAGLGGSSALLIALIAAAERFLDREDSPAELRSAVARDLEAQLMRLPTGRQDHYAALLGGALEIAYRPGRDEVARLDADLDALGERLVVAFTGKSHFSAAHNWEVIRRRLNGDPESVRLFEGIGVAAAEAGGALERGDYPRLGALMAEEWSFRRQLSQGISTPRVEELLQAAGREGSWGGKACGAGGGGSVAVLCPRSRRRAVERALTAAGAELLRARPSSRGVSVEVLV